MVRSMELRLEDFLNATKGYPGETPLYIRYRGERGEQSERANRILLIEDKKPDAEERALRIDLCRI
jgi:hypothetical protein